MEADKTITQETAFVQIPTEKADHDLGLDPVTPTCINKDPLVPTVKMEEGVETITTSSSKAVFVQIPDDLGREPVTLVCPRCQVTVTSHVPRPDTPPAAICLGTLIFIVGLWFWYEVVDWVRVRDVVGWSWGMVGRWAVVFGSAVGLSGLSCVPCCIIKAEGSHSCPKCKETLGTFKVVQC